MANLETTYLLHANRALADEAKKRAARDAFAGDQRGVRASLGVEHATASDLALSQWELWGDGRQVVGDMQRLIAVYRLLGVHGLQVSAGTARQVATFLKRYLGPLQDAGFEALGLTRSERSVCELAREYCRWLDEAEMVELSQALAAIEGPMCRLAVHGAGPLLLDEPLATFYGKVLSDEVRTASPHPDVDAARFVLLRPEGVTAVEGMVLDEVRESLEGMDVASVAVVAPKPLEAYAALAPALRRTGAVCAVEAAVPLARTAFGRFLISSCKLLGLAGCYGIGDVMDPADDAWIDVATDVALSPYAGIAPFGSEAVPSLAGQDRHDALRAEDLNTLWRSDRLLRAEDAVADLAAVSAGFQAVQVLFSLEGDPIAIIDRFRADARRLHAGAQAVVEEAAAAAVRDLVETAAELRCPTSYVALFAGCISVQASVVDEGAPECEDTTASRPLVLFASFEGAARMAPRSFGEVVLCDVSDAYLNAREEAPATAALAEKFGLRAHAGRMERSRFAFSAAAEAASSRFACVFATRDAASEESFTSFAFDEFVEARFGGSLNAKQAVDAPPRAVPDVLPPDAADFLRDGIHRRGEEHVVTGVGRELLPPTRTASLRRVERGRLARLDVLGFMRVASIGDSTLPCISASAIESYLGCPYRWFLERVVNPRTIDEGFGPLEAGNFAHTLLEEFYLRLRERFGTSRLRDVAAEDAFAVFEEVASAVAKGQYQLPPNGGRYVPATNVEALSAGRLVDGIGRSVAAHRALPEAFEVAATEYAIGGLDDGAVRIGYAGFALDGKVDRIDVDGAGGFAVFDYKGSIDGHAAGDACVSADAGGGLEPSSLPRHVQALVYAQALRRLGLFGATCRAALYTSYRAQSVAGLVTGSYASGDEAIALVSDAKSSVHGPFDAFLDMVEDAVAKRLEGIMSSRIPAEPSSDDVCRYCCNAFCERRRACR